MVLNDWHLLKESCIFHNKSHSTSKCNILLWLNIAKRFVKKWLVLFFIKELSLFLIISGINSVATEFIQDKCKLGYAVYKNWAPVKYDTKSKRNETKRN